MVVLVLTPSSSRRRPVPRPDPCTAPPDTWEGSKYIVLAEQFRDSVMDPFGDLPRKFADLLTRTSTQFGIPRAADPDRVHRDRRCGGHATRS